MLSTSQLFELSTKTKSTLKQSGKLIGSGVGVGLVGIGSGVGLGLSGVGKLADRTGQVLYKSINKKESPLAEKEPIKDGQESEKSTK